MKELTSLKTFKTRSNIGGLLHVLVETAAPILEASVTYKYIYITYKYINIYCKLTFSSIVTAIIFCQL